jgi:enoyl-CoA hydratase/carnithine racemase/predicted RNase H-like HicB family nuclease
MLLEFFLENARIEPAADGTRYCGRVPEFPELDVEAATPEECRARIAEAISALLALESGRRSSDSKDHTPEPAGSRPPAGPDPAGTVSSRRGKEEEAARVIEQVDEQQAGHSEFTEIIYEKRDWVARVTINRPEVYNTYTGITLREMAAAFEDAASDPAVAVIVLTGAGDRAFCAGGDVKEHSEEHVGNPEVFGRWVESLIRAQEALMQSGKPSIARINGMVAGGGNEWNMACDLAIAAEHAKFVQVETKVGISDSVAAARWLPLFVGERRAREMLLAGEPVSANKALLWGLVNDVVPSAELDSAVEKLCAKLIDRFPVSLNHTRHQLSHWKDRGWEAAIRDWRERPASLYSTDEAREGLLAMAERREVDYRAFRRGSVGQQRALFEVYKPAEGRDENQSESYAREAAGRICPSCHAAGLPAGFDFCGHCGARLS